MRKANKEILEKLETLLFECSKIGLVTAYERRKGRRLLGMVVRLMAKAAIKKNYALFPVVTFAVRSHSLATENLRLRG